MPPVLPPLPGNSSPINFNPAIISTAANSRLIAGAENRWLPK
jgi:hypothetical protein